MRTVETASVKWCACGACLSVRVETPDFTHAAARLRDRLMRMIVSAHVAKCAVAK